ncbi:SMR family transporter [Gluconobacter sp. GP1]|uniref:DMT family transporter n=1 Tax=Gluconobacter sp. GP1 TaxID=3046423 RepID=UPI00293F4906|nr:SMR family transporter [Gluconobacter sp. GP1]
MKQSGGLPKLWPSIITLVGMLISFGLISIAMKSLPLRTAYTFWTGIGAIEAFWWGLLFWVKRLRRPEFKLRSL